MNNKILIAEQTILIQIISLFFQRADKKALHKNSKFIAAV